MHTLSGLGRFARSLGLDPAALSDSERQRMHAALAVAADALEHVTGRWLLPRRLTITHIPLRRTSCAVALRHDLLELHAVSADGIALPLDSVVCTADGLLRCADGQPFAASTVEVSGLWAYHPEPQRAWRTSETSLTSAMSEISPGMLIVASADGLDEQGQSPRFDAGQLLRVDNELFWLLSVNTASHTLNVMRAASGSNRTPHSMGAPVLIYTPPPTLESLAMRWAAWVYRQPDRAEHFAAPLALADEARAFTRPRVG